MARNDDATNRFAVRAALLSDMASERAAGVADATSDQDPINEQNLTTEQAAQMWHHTPAQYADDPAGAFWQIHDQVLQQTGDNGQAEAQALNTVYPYRAQMFKAGTVPIEQQIDLADSIAKRVGDEKPPAPETVPPPSPVPDANNPIGPIASPQDIAQSLGAGVAGPPPPPPGAFGVGMPPAPGLTAPPPAAFGIGVNAPPAPGLAPPPPAAFGIRQMPPGSPSPPPNPLDALLGGQP